MKIVDPKSVETTNNVHHVQTGMLYNKEHAVAIHITLEAGGKLKRHITPVDVFFYILEGEPTIEIGEETQKVTADHLVESPANIAHAISNETEHRARILVVKAPKPTTTTNIV